MQLFDSEKFFEGFRPCEVLPWELLKAARKDSARCVFSFKPIGAPDELTTDVYGMWDARYGMLSFSQTIDTNIPMGKKREILDGLNKAANFAGHGLAMKVCVMPPGAYQDKKTIILLCGWSVGVYDLLLTEEEGMEFLRKLSLRMMVRLIMEVYTTTLELGEAYPRHMKN